MKYAIAVTAIIALLSFSLVSCRNYDMTDGTYGYYNDRATDRENGNKRSVPESTKNRIMDSYNKAKNSVKNTVDSAAEYIGNAVGVR